MIKFDSMTNYIKGLYEDATSQKSTISSLNESLNEADFAEEIKEEETTTKEFNLVYKKKDSDDIYRFQCDKDGNVLKFANDQLDNYIYVTENEDEFENPHIEELETTITLDDGVTWDDIDEEEIEEDYSKYPLIEDALFESARVWTPEDIKAVLARNDDQVGKALVKLYERQTDDEQEGKYTQHQNGAGFSAFDAEILSSLAEYYIKHHKLSPKQLELARKKVMRYAKQLARIANAIQEKREKLASWEDIEKNGRWLYFDKDGNEFLDKKGYEEASKSAALKDYVSKVQFAEEDRQQDEKCKDFAHDFYAWEETHHNPGYSGWGRAKMFYDTEYSKI